MNTLSKTLLLSLMAANLSYSIEADKVREQELFEENISQLDIQIAEFVLDFATWPKEEQDKVQFRNNNIGGIVPLGIIGTPAASDKYDGSIGYWLDCRLTPKQIEPFCSALNYLKKQKKNN